MTATGPRMGFVGVTTGSSSIMKVFPRWAEALRLPTRVLVGHDITVGADPQCYRDVVRSIKSDPTHLGALVTTHKISVFDAARDLFDDLDDLATTFGEISSIAKRGSRLTGAAKDPVTVRLALDDFLPADHFTATGAVDALLATLPSASLVVNATGMGKDRPGSPLTAVGRFPEQGVVWEFNYRGSLEFLHQARTQQDERRLLVEDGWRYFVHGWTEVIADVFDIPMPPETVEELARIAASAR